MPEILEPFNEEDKMLAALMYPFWFVVSWMVLLSAKKQEPFLRFHALQSLVFGGATAIGYVIFTFVVYLIFKVLSLLPFMRSTSPVVGLVFMLFFIVWIIGLLALAGLCLYYASLAAKGEVFKIFYLGNLVEQWMVNASPETSEESFIQYRQ
jgi:uncharacterized membrane protein